MFHQLHCIVNSPPSIHRHDRHKLMWSHPRPCSKENLQVRIARLNTCSIVSTILSKLWCVQETWPWRQQKRLRARTLNLWRDGIPHIVAETTSRFMILRKNVDIWIALEMEPDEIYKFEGKSTPRHNLMKNSKSNSHNSNFGLPSTFLQLSCSKYDTSERPRNVQNEPCPNRTCSPV